MEKTPLFKFLLLANALGAAYGFIFYYGGQLLTTNPLLWVFVPDCPLYAFVFALALLLLSEKKEAGWFYFLVFVGAMKYGFWTMYVLGKYSYYYFAPDPLISFMYGVLFISHLVLFLEPTIMLGRIRVKLEWLGVAIFWFLLNDWVDYSLGTHPPVPFEKIPEIFTATVLMTFAFSLLAFWLVKRFEPKKVSASSG
jgi:uncharacterized membrane protein YpjA